MQKSKINLLMGVGIALCFLGSNSFCQYSKWEIEAAIKYLKKRQVLDNLIKLTEEDQAKLASRPDVLIACYEILRQTEQMKTLLNQKIAQIETLIHNPVGDSLSNKIDSTEVREEFISQVVAEVEMNLENFTDIIRMKKDLEFIYVRIDSLESKMKILNGKIDLLFYERKLKKSEQ